MKAHEAATVALAKAAVAGESVTAVTSAVGESLVQRRADALVAVAESFLATGYREGLAGERNQVQVIVEIGEVAAACGCESHQTHIDGGPAIAEATARRIACDASLVVLTEDSSGNVLDVGRRTRTIPPAIARALWRRDGGCRFPGYTCERFVDGRHVIHWAHGGETNFAAQAVGPGQLVASQRAWLCRLYHCGPAGVARRWTTPWRSAPSRPSRGGRGWQPYGARLSYSPLT